MIDRFYGTSTLVGHFKPKLLYDLNIIVRNQILQSIKNISVGSVGSVSASRTVGLEFASRPGHTKDQLSKRPGSVWNCLWGNALKRSPGIIRKSRVSYPVPGFLSSATWPLLPKKHYNGLNQIKQSIKGNLLKHQLNDMKI